MMEGASSEVTLNFDDVIVQFSKDEWSCLELWQKDLYLEVAKENYDMLVSLGYPVVTPPILMHREEEGQFSYDRHLGVSSTCSPVFKTPVHFQNEEEEEPVSSVLPEASSTCCRIVKSPVQIQSEEEGEPVNNNLPGVHSTCYSIANSLVLVQSEEEEEDQLVKDHCPVNRIDYPNIPPIRIKSEEADQSISNQDSAVSSTIYPFIKPPVFIKSEEEEQMISDHLLGFSTASVPVVNSEELVRLVKQEPEEAVLENRNEDILQFLVTAGFDCKPETGQLQAQQKLPENLCLEMDGDSKKILQLIVAGALLYKPVKEEAVDGRIRRHSVETVLGHPLATKWRRYATDSNIGNVRDNGAVPAKYQQGTTRTQLQLPQKWEEETGTRPLSPAPISLSTATCRRLLRVRLHGFTAQTSDTALSPQRVDAARLQAQGCRCQPTHQLTPTHTSVGAVSSGAGLENGAGGVSCSPNGNFSGRKSCRGHLSERAAVPVSGGSSTQTEPSDGPLQRPVRHRRTPRTEQGRISERIARSCTRQQQYTDGPPSAARMQFSQIAARVVPEAKTFPDKNYFQQHDQTNVLFLSLSSH
ncbi:hypothetical protein NDU88_003800 [Pleurodeles waltl]|uniref:Uncharacterized protein n=1 Tax=Pleurodeles waltl TaxID=8319 RepID=A0AAV7M646_PLEWA|nr:hypothetical protein NDU88_003800 [Pleurodeles waltl]